MRRPRVRGLRGRLMLITVVGATILTAALTTGFNVVVQRHLHEQANDLLKQRADAHVAALTLRGGRIVTGSVLDDASRDQPFWIYEGGRALQRPAASSAAQRAADALEGRGKIAFENVPAAGLRLYTEPIVDVRLGRRPVGALVAAVSVAPFDATGRHALAASLLIAILVLVATIVAAHLVLAGALGPVDRLTAEAAARSEHDLDRRFSLGEPYDELTRLAATFDQLLARVAAVLRHERRFTGEMAHELRTPLAKIITKGDLALRRERDPDDYRDALASIVRNARSMQHTLESLLATARIDATGAAGVGDAREAAERTAGARAASADERGVRVEITSGRAPCRVGASTEVVERMLAPIVDNGCRHAVELVQISLDRVNGHVHITVDDDGAGVPATAAETVFEPGVQLGEGRHDGAGLGLALARRLARSAGGEVECLRSDSGARFTLRLPAA